MNNLAVILCTICVGLGLSIINSMNYSFAVLTGSWEDLGGSSAQIDSLYDSKSQIPIVFSVGLDDGRIYYKYQLLHADGKDWSDWISLGGNLKQIDTALDKFGRVNVFGIGSSDNSTYYKYQLSPGINGSSGNWSDWIRIGGPSKQIKVESDRTGNLVLFSINKVTTIVYYKYQFVGDTNGNATNWSDWISLGGNLKQIDTALDKFGRVNVFGIGSSDNSTYYKYQLSPGINGSSGNWSDWIRIGGPSKQIKVESDRTGNLVLFSINKVTTIVYYKYQFVGDTNGNATNWSDWISLGTPSNEISAITTSVDGSPLLFSIEWKSNLLKYLYFRPNILTGNARGWLEIGGGNIQISVTGNQKGDIFIFSISKMGDNVYYYNIQAEPKVLDKKFYVDVIFDGRGLTPEAQVTGLSFLDKDNILLLQKNDGKVRLISHNVLMPEDLIDFPVDPKGEGGLLGVAVADVDDPLGRNNISKYVFFYYSEATSDGKNANANRIYRYEWNGSSLINGHLILSLPKEFVNHNGGKIVVDPDNHHLYTVIGDQNRDSKMQNIENGSEEFDTGVVLRTDYDGNPVSNNPFINESDSLSKVFAYGIRNSFGMALDPLTTNLWMTENGESEYDEINLVHPGANSGWKKVMGPLGRTNVTNDQLVNLPNSHYEDPKFSTKDTVAFTDLEFIDSTKLANDANNSLIAADFNNGNLYFLTLNKARNGLFFGPSESNLTDLVADNYQELYAVRMGTNFGGITDIAVSIDGSLYVLNIEGKIYRLTSNIPA